MAKVTLVAFQDGPDHYFAYGRDRFWMPVYKVLVDEFAPTHMRFPSCLSFMQYATVGRRERVDLEDVFHRYGRLASKTDNLQTGTRP